MNIKTFIYPGHARLDFIMFFILCNANNKIILEDY